MTLFSIVFRSFACSASTIDDGTADIAAWKTFFAIHFSGFPSLIAHTNAALVTVCVTARAAKGCCFTASEACRSRSAILYNTVNIGSDAELIDMAKQQVQLGYWVHEVRRTFARRGVQFHCTAIAMHVACSMSGLGLDLTPKVAAAETVGRGRNVQSTYETREYDVQRTDRQRRHDTAIGLPRHTHERYDRGML